MTYKLLFNINHLLFADDLDKVETSYFVLYNDIKKRTDFFTADLLNNVGIIELQIDDDLSVYGYDTIEFTYTNDKYLNPEEESNENLAYFLGYLIKDRGDIINTLLDFLWFVRDNSVGLVSVIAYIPERNGLVAKLVMFKHNSNCICEEKAIHFSKDEIENAFAIAVKYSMLCPADYHPLDYQANEEIIKLNYSTFKLRPLINPDSLKYHNFNCLERAMTFLSIAREATQLIYKIAFYVPIFECLFTTDASEVTTKVSERIAFYLGTNKAERKELSKTIRNAYAIRSRFLHGQNFEPREIRKITTNENLIALAIRIDEITRVILTRVIMVDSDKFLDKDKEQSREDFLTNLIFE